MHDTALCLLLVLSGPLEMRAHACKLEVSDSSLGCNPPVQWHHGSATCGKPSATLISSGCVLRQARQRSAHSARPAISTPSRPDPAQPEAPTTALSAHQHAWLDSLEMGRRVPHARRAAALQPLQAPALRAA